MDSIEFLLIIGSFAVVLFWYVKNATDKTDGAAGLLALTVAECEKESTEPRRSYRIKSRNAPACGARSDLETKRAKSQDPALTYKIHDDNAKLRRRYRQQDVTRYRVKDKVGAYRDIKTSGAA